MDTVHVAWLGLRLTGPTEGAWTLAPRSGGPSMGRLVTSQSSRALSYTLE